MLRNFHKISLNFLNNFEHETVEDCHATVPNEKRDAVGILEESLLMTNLERETKRKPEYTCHRTFWEQAVSG
jgi:hypothetical protein